MKIKKILLIIKYNLAPKIITCDIFKINSLFYLRRYISILVENQEIDSISNNKIRYCSKSLTSKIYQRILQLLNILICISYTRN